MRTTRRPEVWFGVFGIVAGAALLFSGLVVTSDKAQAADNGIGITILRDLPNK